jgi:hypothetical protein
VTRVKISARLPSSLASVVSAKVRAAVSRALAGPARARIAALVVARGGAAADKLAPDFAGRYRRELRRRGAVEVTDKAVTITVTDPLVRAVERGVQGFDMKPALLSRGKVGRGGAVYADVPLRHKAGSVPQAVRTAGRRAARAFDGVGTLRMPARTEGRVFTREVHRGPISQALGVGPRTQAIRHARGVRDDLIRTSVRRSRTTVSVRYTTIRRVSSRSPASSWWHPGFRARRVLDDVLPGGRREIAAIIREAISSQREG